MRHFVVRSTPVARIRVLVTCSASTGRPAPPLPRRPAGVVPPLVSREPPAAGEGAAARNNPVTGSTRAPILGSRSLGPPTFGCLEAGGAPDVVATGSENQPHAGTGLPSVTAILAGDVGRLGRAGRSTPVPASAGSPAGPRRFCRQRLDRLRCIVAGMSGVQIGPRATAFTKNVTGPASRPPTGEVHDCPLHHRVVENGGEGEAAWTDAVFWMQPPDGICGKRFWLSQDMA